MCGCESNTTANTATATVDGRAYLISGMTCQSCATKVGDAVRGVAGVTDIQVDIAEGRLTVSGTADDEAIRAAVTGAGYQIRNA